MAQRISRTKKALVVAAAIALSIGGAGAAFAYWTSTGTGNGTATTGQEVAFVITEGTKAGVLAPGSAGQTVNFTVSNPGPGQLLLSTVTVSIADAAGVAWVPTGTCLLSDYTATITTAPTPGTMVAGASGNKTGVVTVTMANSELNQDDCQGQSVPLHFVANPTTP